MGRYSSLYRLPGGLYTHGCPLLISAGALLRDDQIGRVLVQLKFRNLTRRVVKAVKVSLRAFDVSGEELAGVAAYQYLDLAAGLGADFGDRLAVPLPDPVTRSFEVTILSVLFDDGSSWSSDEEDVWDPLPRPIALLDVLEAPELVAQYVRETTDRSAYAPEELDDLWYCSCGAVNRQEYDECYACGLDKDTAFRSLDRDFLSDRLEELYRQQELDSAVEQVHTKKRRSALLKILLILVPLLIVAGAGYFGVTEYLLPRLAYDRAAEMMAMEDYDGASLAFAALGDYKDAADKVTEADYCNAMAMMKEGRLEDAKAAFVKLGNYGESLSMIVRCDYLAAQELLEEKNYDAAMDAFLALGDYEDSAAQAQECLYLKAQSLLDAGQEDDAIAILEALEGYKDSADTVTALRQAKVEHVNSLIRQNKMDEAWAEYELLVDYRPDPLTAEDFVNPDGDMCEFLDENTTGEKHYGFYNYEPGNGFASRKEVTSTAREIRLGDKRLAVLMAYGEPDESGELIVDGGFYPLLSEASQAKMLEECVKYDRYSFNNYRIYFYYDTNDAVSWIFFSNEDYFCSTHIVPEATEGEGEEAAEG